MKLHTILAIGSGGFVGAVLRSYVSGLVNKHVAHNIPFGTLSVNLLGSFALGSLFAYFTYTTIFSPTIKSFLSTGIMGAFTTYSTFAVESFFMINGGMYVTALSNMMLNVFGTVIMAGAGFKMFEAILK
ncbi:MAG: fluoride efflux transporter CrcB [Epsilonproteobacteria bacterium]|nr:fluoride efflux transporter CrcB [Campylobacterota bacterium]